VPLSCLSIFCWPLEGWAALESLIGGLQKRASIAAIGGPDEETETVLFKETYPFDDSHSDTLPGQSETSAQTATRVMRTDWKAKPRGNWPVAPFTGSARGDTPQADGSATRVNFDDWFYAIDERGCMVRAGGPFATAHVAYRKL
jgi:hypothetical protein